MVRTKVDAPALASGDRVTLLLITRTPGALQLSPEADSSKLGTTAALPYGLARQVVTAAREDGRLRLAVRDDGQGIDPAVLPRIFEPFYTGDDVQGSGLGLAIASELAERMSGRLWVRSRRGETTFMLEIPALASEIPRADGPRALRVSQPASPS